MDEFDLKIKSGGLVFLLSLVFMDLQLNTQNDSLRTPCLPAGRRTLNSELNLPSAIRHKL